MNGACSPIGKAAIAAITKARGMELGGAIDSVCVGMDAGEVWIYYRRNDHHNYLSSCSNKKIVIVSLQIFGFKISEVLPDGHYGKESLFNMGIIKLDDILIIWHKLSSLLVVTCFFLLQSMLEISFR